MTMPVMKLIAVALLLVLTGCSGPLSKHDNHAPSSGGKTYTLNDLGAALGCKNYTPSDAMMFASETGDCTGAGGVGQITMNLFNNNTARDKYVKVGIANGAVYVVGNRWLVECDTRTQQNAVAAAVEDGSKRG